MRIPFSLPVLRSVASCVLLCTLTACGYEARIAALQTERDSLVVAGEQQSEELNTLTAYVADIAMSIDSIAIQEQVLLSNRDRDGYFLSRRQIRENLTYFSELIERQRERIAILEDSLAVRGESVASLKSIVSFLSDKLQEKEIEIDKMRGVVTQQKRTIKKLESDVATLKTNVFELEEKNKVQAETIVAQETALTAQDVALNEAYMRIGTRKELKADGLLAGGFWQKKTASKQLEAYKFMKVDIRYLREIPLKNKRFHILTPMPEDSYRITNNSDGSCVLHITNPTRFWSLSNMLLIQI